MTNPALGPVVAGVDGSTTALRAAQWAAMEASAQGRALRLVHVLQPTSPYQRMFDVPKTTLAEEVAHDWAERTLKQASDACQQIAADLVVNTDILTGERVQALSEIAAHSPLLVVGSVGLSDSPGIRLGSTAWEVARHAGAAVVVVRPGDRSPTAPRRVIVGVDGSRNSTRAIDYAYDLAARHGADLLAVHAWTDLPMDALSVVRMWDFDWSDVRTAGLELIAEALAGHQERYPDVVVRKLVSIERPAHALIDEATPDDLLVVGSHGRGLTRRAIFGSVSHSMLHAAPCSVAVVRSEPHQVVDHSGGLPSEHPG